MDRETLINEIVKASRRKPLTVVRRIETLGSDGKWYSFSFPCSVTPTETTRAYFVQRAENGTTVGKRYETASDAYRAQDAFADAAAADFRAHLVLMHDSQLQSQADYWLAADRF